MGDEAHLLARVAAGDEGAFARLYDQFADRVFRYSLTLLRDRHLAEEVTQETMTAVWKGAGSYSGRSRVSTWNFGIARNQAHRLLEREARARRRIDEPLFLPDPAEEIGRKEAVLHALEQLPASQREVVFLTFYEGLSYPEIAEVLGVPEGTVKSRMFHARRKLAEALR